MVRPISIFLALLAAGCAGGDLSRADTDAGLGADAGDDTGTPAPVTTGLTGVSGVTSDGDNVGSTSAGATAADTEDPTDDPADASTGGAGESSGSDDAESSGGPGTSGTTTDTDPVVEGVDLSGWTVTQANSAREITLPEGTVVPVGGVVVIGRDATRGAFEQHWGALADDVVYVDGGDIFPAINGDETFTLRDAGSTVIDGPTPALETGQALRRADLSAEGTWTSSPEVEVDPGVGHPDPGTTGVFITEVSDTNGSGAYVYEYVELQAW